MGNKRKFERFDITAPARLEILLPDENRYIILIEKLNLSANGVFINTTKLVPEGSPVKMEILFHFSDPETQIPSARATAIVVTGRILRSTEEGMAISFNNDYEIISSEDQKILD